MYSFLNSLSLKSQELSKAERERERKIESMQRDLHEEQKRVNTSYDVKMIVLYIDSSCCPIYLSSHHAIKTKSYFTFPEIKEMLEKRDTVAFSAYRSSSQTLSNGEIVIFDGVWTNVGNGYERSIGVFKAPNRGLYHLTAVVMSTDGNSLGLNLCHNGLRMTRSYLTGDEKVLEKLVRLEHKMELFEEKMKTMESSMSKKLKRMDEIEKETETLTDTMLDKQLQIETRINDSYQEIINNFKTQSNNETTLYEEKMDSLFDSLSLKSQTLSEAEKERERKIVSMQRDSHEEHKRFNTSSDAIVKNFKVQSNKTLQELILQQQKGKISTRCWRKRETVAFSAYGSSSQTLSSREKVIFDGTWTNVGNGYEPITGIFEAPHPGLYHLTAVVMSTDGKSLGLDLYHNGLG
ncbi:C1QL [Mytilus edulis]|uniref:C1QL n=1 Tax=Mytilus edulis TaxID=6550 RepID=A0A8S3U580_MYTED|nr:C1QL [Mytilus edulis]